MQPGPGTLAARTQKKIADKFSCAICEPGKGNAWFTTGEPNPSRVQIDSVLGETTMDGVLRVLGSRASCSHDPTNAIGAIRSSAAA